MCLLHQPFNSGRNLIFVHIPVTTSATSMPLPRPHANRDPAVARCYYLTTVLSSDLFLYIAVQRRHAADRIFSSGRASFGGTVSKRATAAAVDRFHAARLHRDPRDSPGMRYTTHAYPWWSVRGRRQMPHELFQPGQHQSP